MGHGRAAHYDPHFISLPPHTPPPPPRPLPPGRIFFGGGGGGGRRDKNTIPARLVLRFYLRVVSCCFFRPEKSAVR